MSNASTIAKALGGQRRGTGWLCCCPAHHDSSPSLSIRDSKKGLLVHCFAGCDWKDVKDTLKDMGLLSREYRPEDYHNPNSKKSTKRKTRLQPQ